MALGVTPARIRTSSRFAAAAVALALLILVSLAGTPPPAHSGDGATLALDADISDGACVDIDSFGAASNGPGGGSVFVAVCLENPGTVPVAAFEYRVIYDDTVVVAPEVADQPPGNDDNPDANVGSTTYASATFPNHLGGGWQCDGGVGAHPKGDSNQAIGPENGEAYSGGCISQAGPNTLLEGPLGVIEFQFVGSGDGTGTATLALRAVSVTDDALNEIGSCAPTVDVAMACLGATIASGAGLSLDLDASDGFCNDANPNATRTVDAGTSFDVGVCFRHEPYPNEGILGMSFRVTYDDTIIRAPEVAGAGAGVEDNPDAAPGLPATWECDNPYPVGDFDGVPWNGTGEARSSCFYENHPNPPSGALFNGLFSVIHFEAGAPGTTSLAFSHGFAVQWTSGTGGGTTFGCPNGNMYCFGGTITVLCVQPDAECDGANDGIDNCLGLYNPDQFNTDSDPRDNGPLAPSDDATSMTTDASGNACDSDDDGDGIADADEAVHPVTGCPSSTAALNAIAIDSDGDHHHDGWECTNGVDPANAASNFGGTSTADADADRVQDRWELRGYNGSGGTTDSDGDGCHDLVEVASIDGNKVIAPADYLAVARRALNIWGPNAAQDYVLDVDKNGVVADPDRLFVTRAALLSDWQPKSCP